MSSKSSESPQKDLNAAPSEQEYFWVFGPYTLYTTQLLGPGGELIWRKTPKFSVLLELVKAEGMLVSKESLLNAAWGPIAADSNLFTAISAIRTELAMGLKSFKGYEGRTYEDIRASVIENKLGEGYRITVPVKKSNGGPLAILPAADIAAQPVKPLPQSKMLNPLNLPRKILALLLPILTLILAGYVVQRKAFFSRQSHSFWQRQIIQSSEEGRQTTWGFGGPDGEKAIAWKDIFWIGQEGWLCGATVIGGGGGDVGTGILLHTSDRGVSWTRIGKEKFDSGSGHFPWGPGGTFVYNWEEVGPMYSLHAYPRPVGGEKFQVDLWLAATTGMYHSEDDGQTWQRSTPRPDDSKHLEIYATLGIFLT
jgi:DNA-binding winged helix-turn-helix (wHTH) protein